ncbi:hypothetical protein [Neobacillus cucumis]|jgi:hypothetical protein|uniref:hypothetical protein n=1 Tax=Neobacillus cucumis TaxID=1740721 RepID=UPI002E227326|nr:hypothetical protein [Neobacillus cucumis]
MFLDGKADREYLDQYGTNLVSMELAEIGKQESGGVTRTSLSPEDLTARKLLMNWMQ